MRTVLRTLASLVLALWIVSTLLQSASAQSDDAPDLVVIPGTLQSKLGCPGDWQPECENTALALSEADGIWRGVFDVPAGAYEYKVALNGSWAENYGALAKRDGPNIPLGLESATTVRFYYDHVTHWVADSATSVIATAVGDFQTALGCPADWRADCLRSWLQDPDGDGIYSFSTSALPAGEYAVQVALDEGAGPVYGADGVADGARIAFRVPRDGQVIYFGFDPGSRELTVSTTGAPRGNLNAARAHWVARDVIAWKLPAHTAGTTYWLHVAPEGGLKLNPAGVEGGEAIELSFFDSKLPIEVFAANPHLSGYSALKLGASDLVRVPEILKGQIAVSARNSAGEPIDATSLQIPGVLDDLYAYDGTLGVALSDGIPTLRLWAPTAQDVILHVYADATTATDVAIPMTLDAAAGVWSAVGEASWVGRYYLYEVVVYVPRTGQVERNFVTDPYSVSLATNSLRSQIVDLAAIDLQPEGWADLAKPPLAAPEDAVIYELHIRDFSISDETVPPEMRGTYLAFAQPEAAGMQHLRGLAEAGLTHIHLLPTFDIASVDEDRSTWQAVDSAALARLAPDSSEQAAALGAIRDSDGFNWGYDPFHYTVPEGSYATAPEGASRITEFRSMVKGLNQAGLRVIMDVVYNHTTASGQDAKSVLDRIVPGYYHRLNADGQVETSTCCQNTATEHAMMEKLMIDSVVTWATAYKVDGFRFDLMGHHLRAHMEHVRAALDALTLEADGIDGRSIVLYGEGWDFGEVAANARGINATQLNLGGAGIGLFNDRLRDGVRGGGPFSGLQEQGFATGLFDDPNGTSQGDADEQRTRLLRYADWIRIGLAGNLADFGFIDRAGRDVVGSQIDYNGSPAGYTQDPQENILYVSAHDNETLFDAIQFKAPEATTMADRVRMQNLANSVVMLGQGVPFFHAGDDLLRSKSGDRNSYNSGDWFNRLDFTYASNNWGVGLPPDSQGRAEVLAPLLADPALKPAQADILAASAAFRELLQIRRSSPLFRLRTADAVAEALTFQNTGPDQIPGLIVMTLTDRAGVDATYDRIVVMFNATRADVNFAIPDLSGGSFALHPVLQNSADAVVRTASFDPGSATFTVPGRTTAVFVLTDVDASAPPAPTATTAPAPATLQPDPTPTVVSGPKPTQEPSPWIGTPTAVALAMTVMASIVGALWFVNRKPRK
ncbi:MAG TPA: pullulanase-type alpha-1,6-glucosidase [Anaerolineales bacterium]|nr:pullulanase-type alpha-1,6-glucosidase [Anaerolineales bacterium]